MPDSAITPGSSLALIGNAAEQTFGAERPSRSEAFSIRRPGGSRWVCGGRGVTRLEPITELLHPQAETC
jgi:hypothetical protein